MRYLVLIMLCCSTLSSAQSRLIIIDTLVGYPPVTGSREQFYLLFNHCGSLDDIESDTLLFQDPVIRQDSYPNVVVMNVTSDEVCILLDNKGGTFRLKGILALTAIR